MSRTIEVRIEYYSYFERITGKKSEKIRISPGLKEAFDDIHKYMADNYSLNDEFMLMINNDNVIGLLREGKTAIISEGDILKVIPMIIGG